MKSILVATLVVFASVAWAGEGSAIQDEGAVTSAPVDSGEGAVTACDARAENPSGDPTATCCCRTSGGGACCAETAFCSGGFVPGCVCQ